MSNQKILGIINFQDVLLFSNDTLGIKVPITIKGVQGTLLMPFAPKIDEVGDPFNKMLIPPKSVQSWKEGGNPIIWGYYNTYSNSVSNVEKVLVEFMLPDNKLEEKCNEIYSGFNDWYRLFYQFTKLITKQNTLKTVQITNMTNQNISLYNAKANYYQSDNKSNIKIVFPDENKAINKDKLGFICKLASEGQPPKAEYKLLLEAYNARINNDPRKAIIEAATSLEICLTNRIIEELNILGVTFGEELLKKFRMLGGLFELMKILGINLPTNDFKSKIIEPRNDVIHKATFCDMNIANDVILDVEKYLEEYTKSLV